MRLKNIIIPTLLINSLFAVTSVDIPKLCIELPSNTFGVSNYIGKCDRVSTPTPTPEPTPTATLEYVAPTIKIDATNVNGESGEIPTAGYEVEYAPELLKEIIDESTKQIVQAKEVLSSNGVTTQTKIEIPKDITNAVVLKVTTEAIDKAQNRDMTTLEAEDKVKVTLSSDGGFNSKVTTNELEAEVKVNANAEATTKIIVQKKVEVEMKSPKGAEIKQENSGKVISKSKIDADTGESNLKPIEVEMVAEVSGNLKTTAHITNDNGEILTFKLELPVNVNSGNMELVKKESDSNTYSAIKSNFKTSTNFKVTDKSRRSIIAGDNIEIVGTSSWQKFEEKQYFNGKRTITLLLGSANVIKDGEEEELEKEVEYELLPPSIIQSSNIELTQIYNNSYLNIQKGWNLISNPIGEALNIKDTLKYASTTYKYSNGWIKDVKTLNQNEGIWINYTRHVSEKIEGNFYEPTFNNLSSGWNLFGAGRDINLSELNSFSEIWAYDSKLKAWVKNPAIIYRGYGFWAKF